MKCGFALQKEKISFGASIVCPPALWLAGQILLVGNVSSVNTVDATLIESPLTTYNIAQGGFAKVLKKFSKKFFYSIYAAIPYYGEISEMPNIKVRFTIIFSFLAFIRLIAYNYR